MSAEEAMPKSQEPEPAYHFQKESQQTGSSKSAAEPYKHIMTMKECMEAEETDSPRQEGPTLETDAEELGTDGRPTGLAPAVFARSLERRLQEALRDNEKYLQHFSVLVAERDAALRELADTQEALREEPGKWGWDVVILVGQRVLKECYPADIFIGASGDLGPVYIVALRNALAALAEKGKP